MTNTHNELLGLAEQVEGLDARIMSASQNEELSVSGKATAISMIVILNLDLLRDVASCLRAHASLREGTGR